MQRTSIKSAKSLERGPSFVVDSSGVRRRPTLDKSPWAKSSWRSAPTATAKSGWGITRKN